MLITVVERFHMKNTFPVILSISFGLSQLLAPSPLMAQGGANSSTQNSSGTLAAGLTQASLGLQQAGQQITSAVQTVSPTLGAAGNLINAVQNGSSNPITNGLQITNAAGNLINAGGNLAGVNTAGLQNTLGTAGAGLQLAGLGQNSINAIQNGNIAGGLAGLGNTLNGAGNLLSQNGLAGAGTLGQLGQLAGSVSQVAGAVQPFINVFQNPSLGGILGLFGAGGNALSAAAGAVQNVGVLFGNIGAAAAPAPSFTQAFGDTTTNAFTFNTPRNGANLTRGTGPSFFSKQAFDAVSNLSPKSVFETFSPTFFRERTTGVMSPFQMSRLNMNQVSHGSNRSALRAANPNIGEAVMGADRMTMVMSGDTLAKVSIVDETVGGFGTDEKVLDNRLEFISTALGTQEATAKMLERSLSNSIDTSMDHAVQTASLQGAKDVNQQLRASMDNQQFYYAEKEDQRQVCRQVCGVQSSVSSHFRGQPQQYTSFDPQGICSGNPDKYGPVPGGSPGSCNSDAEVWCNRCVDSHSSIAKEGLAPDLACPLGDAEGPVSNPSSFGQAPSLAAKAFIGEAGEGAQVDAASEEIAHSTDLMKTFRVFFGDICYVNDGNGSSQSVAKSTVLPSVSPKQALTALRDGPVDCPQHLTEQNYFCQNGIMSEGEPLQHGICPSMNGLLDAARQNRLWTDVQTDTTLQSQWAEASMGIPRLNADTIQRTLKLASPTAFVDGAAGSTGPGHLQSATQEHFVDNYCRACSVDATIMAYKVVAEKANDFISANTGLTDSESQDLTTLIQAQMVKIKNLAGEQDGESCETLVAKLNAATDIQAEGDIRKAQASMAAFEQAGTRSAFGTFGGRTPNPGVAPTS